MENQNDKQIQTIALLMDVNSQLTRENEQLKKDIVRLKEKWEAQGFNDCKSHIRYEINQIFNKLGENNESNI